MDAPTPDKERLRLDEAGVIAILFAMLIVLITVLASLAIDVGSWYYHAGKVQNAADAAALGGVVYLPGDLSGAQAAALQIAGANGFPNGGNVSVTSAPVPGNPTQFRVTVTETEPTLFAGMIGLNTETISRSAVAEYEQPVDMGSPASSFGNEPVTGTGIDVAWSNANSLLPPFKPQLWASIYGPQQNKSNGDSLQTVVCDSATKDGCQGGTGRVNVDYSPDGYFYKVTVDPTIAATHHALGEKLAIEVFDPAAVTVGNHCDGGGLNGITASNSNDYSTAADAAVRYGWGDASNTPNKDSLGAWCTGDNGTATTTFAVRQDITPATPALNPILSIPADSNAAGCLGEQFGSWTDNGNLPNLLRKGDPLYDKHLAYEFRQWVPVCVFDPLAAPAPDYLLQVRTNISPTTNQTLLGGTTASPPASNPLPSDSGGNRFSIRAAWVQGGTPGVAWTAFGANTNANRSPTDPYVGGYGWVAPPLASAPRPVLSLVAPSAGLSISGTTAMGLYANAAAGVSPNYYMARVPASAHGQTLEIRLFDIGDCTGSGCNPTLTFRLPGVFNSIVPGPVATCTWTIHDGPPGTGYGQAQTTVVNNGRCTTTVANSNGSWYTIDIAIPSNYTCTTAFTDCWVQMSYSAGNGGVLNDVTTWGARLGGNPVRIIQ